MWSMTLMFIGCNEEEKSSPDPIDDTGAEQIDDTGLLEDDSGLSDTDDTEEEECEPVIYDPNPFITEVIEVEFGEGAGFGQDQFPNIIYGPPLGSGPNSGTLDVVSLGHNGFITIGFEQQIVDGDGPDLIVFENVFIGWYETGIVSASIDGETWFTWDCDPEDSENGYPGCAGASPSLSHPDNCIDAREPNLAGGDAFDLANIGLSEARYIRITDSGLNPPGGFDLDAIAIVNGFSE